MSLYHQEGPPMSILELFCSVDDFWQQFAPTWQQDLLTSGERQRVRPGQMYRSRNDDYCHLVPAIPLSYVQSLLHRVCPPSPAQRVSHFGGLWAFCRVDAYGAGTPGGLSAHPTGPM